MKCQQCKFCSKLVKLEQGRPGTEGRVCNACQCKALPKCGVGTCKTSQQEQRNLGSLLSILISLGDVGKKQVLYCFKIDEENVLYCSSCNTKVHQMVQHTIGRPRMPYNQASACIKFEILKKATKIYNKSDGNLKNQIDEISQGCSEEVCLLQR